MAEGGEFVQGIVDIYNSLVSLLPPLAQDFVNLFLIVIGVLIYAIFIWNFYRLIASKNILGLDLNKYNKSNKPFFTKLVTGFLYFVEYIIILPIVIFVAFSVFAVFLILLTESIEVSSILIIAAIIVTVIRMASYYREGLSKDLAKLIPFTLLTFAIINLGSLNLGAIISRFQQLPNFFDQVFIYLLFIIGFEVVLRIFDFIISLFGLEEVDEEIKKKEEEESA